MANSREEQLRDSRRLARQLLGAVALVLVVIGLFTVLNWCVGALRAALDDSDRRERFADRVYGLVMFDVLPFDDVSQVDSTVFRQAAIWGTVYQAQKDGTLDDYDRDTETGSLILPQLEIDTYLTNLLGPDYPLEEGSFETEEFIYNYDADRQGYLVPVTGAVGRYTPEVEKIWTQSGKTYVTVGYIPTINNSANGELSLTAPTEPTKYMDFVFSRGENRQWYLTALQESEMQVTTQASATPAPTASIDDPQALVQDNLDSTMTDAAGTGSASSTELTPEENTEGDTSSGDTTTDENTPTEDGTGEDTSDSGDTANEGDTGETTDEPATSTATSD